MKGLKKIAACVIAVSMFAASLPMTLAADLYVSSDDFSEVSGTYTTTDTFKTSLFTDNKLGANASVVACEGMGKSVGDKFIQINTVADDGYNNTTLKSYRNVTVNSDYFVASIQFCFANASSNRLDYKLKVNGGDEWPSIVNFNWNNTINTIGNATYDITPGKWYTIDTAFKKDDKEYKVYINGELISTAMLNLPFTQFNNFDLGIHGITSTIYIDNLSAYESNAEYNKATTNTTVTSSSYTVSGDTITAHRLSNVTANEFLSKITLPEGATASIGKKELNNTKKLVAAEKINNNDMLFVTAANGKTIGEYKLVSELYGNVDDFSLAETTYQGTGTYTPAGMNIFSTIKLSDDIGYIKTGTTGLGKGTQLDGTADRFLTLQGNAWGGTDIEPISDMSIIPQLNNYIIVQVQAYFPGSTGRFQIGMKANKSWITTPFDIKSGVTQNGAGSMTVSTDKWVTLTTVFKQGSTEYKMYINGVQERTAELTSAFTEFDKVQLLQQWNNLTYVDNVSIIESETDYDATQTNTLISSQEYSVSDGLVLIPDYNTTTADEFISNINVPTGARAKLCASSLGSSDVLSGNDTLSNEYKLYVTAADGVTLAEYSVSEVTDVINMYNEDCSNITDGENNLFTRIDKDSALRWGSYYYAIESSNIAVRYNETDKSYLANGDYIGLENGGMGKKSDDKYVKIFADKSETAKQIEFYKQSTDGKYNNFSGLNTLSDKYNFVIEFDIRTDNPNVPVGFSVKISDGTNTGWTNSGFSFGWGKLNNTIAPNNWYHIAVVFHKDTNQYSIYEDGNIITDHATLKIGGVEAIKKPTALKTVDFKINNAANETVTVGLDNIRYYEKYSDYEYTKSISDISADTYDYNNTPNEKVIIGDFNNVSIADFINSITIPQGAEAVVYNTDEFTPATDEIHDGMKLAVYPSDGLSVKLYTLYNDILSSIGFLNADGTPIFEPEGTEITANVSLNMSKNATVYLALFDNNGKIKNMVSSSGYMRNFSVKADNLTDTENSVAKIYLWDSETMKPIIASCPIGE